MSNDLVKRLRDPDFGTETTERKLMDKAADRIEELEKQNASLEAKLAKAIEVIDNAATLVEDRHFLYMALSGRDPKNCSSDLSLIAEELRLASTKLKGEQV
jgi:hypothetical protein